MHLFEILDPIGDWIVAFFHSQPLVGPVLLLTAEEAGIPLPIPGDVYIAYTGYEVSKGFISYLGAFVALMMAILVGSSILYFLASHYGKSLMIRFGKFIHLNEKKLNFIEKKFRKYGPIVIIVGRHLPGFRIPVTVFAGISKVEYKVFIFSEVVSIGVWIWLFLKLGATLGKRTLGLFHNHFAFLYLLGIPLLLSVGTFFFGKFIPEDDD